MTLYLSCMRSRQHHRELLELWNTHVWCVSLKQSQLLSCMNIWGVFMWALTHIIVSVEVPFLPHMIYGYMNIMSTLNVSLHVNGALLLHPLEQRFASIWEFILTGSFSVSCAQLHLVLMILFMNTWRDMLIRKSTPVFSVGKSSAPVFQPRFTSVVNTVKAIIARGVTIDLMLPFNGWDTNAHASKRLLEKLWGQYKLSLWLFFTFAYCAVRGIQVVPPVSGCVCLAQFLGKVAPNFDLVSLFSLLFDFLIKMLWWTLRMFILVIMHKFYLCPSKTLLCVFVSVFVSNISDGFLGY